MRMPHEVGGSSPRPADEIVRVGIGYDSHRFGAGRPLLLGGVFIPSNVGLVGHSDGDAVCHALTDALLGAAGLGDIGEMFPDSDERNKNKDSIEMLSAAVAKLHDHGLRPVQVDITVIAETPKVGPYREKIRQRIGTALGIEPAEVSVKGKTNEGMGWIGRKEGLACIAVATLRGTR